MCWLKKSSNSRFKFSAICFLPSILYLIDSGGIEIDFTGVEATGSVDGIVFESGKSDIKPESEGILEKAYNTLSQNPEIVVEIRGYTDNTGSRSKNMKLSQARADVVKDFFVKKGILMERVMTKGFGQENPIAPNTTKEGKQKNRRIEFFRVK